MAPTASGEPKGIEVPRAVNDGQRLAVRLRAGLCPGVREVASPRFPLDRGNTLHVTESLAERGTGPWR